MMRIWGFLILIYLILQAPASAWNEKGHLAIARLAWLKLSACEQMACTKILQSHPHYAEYLIADKPAEFSADEWAFMRASYWPDWVRSNHTEEFNQPTWHYVTAAFVPPYSKLKAGDLPGAEPNIVTQIPASLKTIESGTPAERAISLCWLLHLVGDIHQPLHCCSQLSELFPRGDQGGNLAMVRIANGMPIRLHFAWDAMLGTELDPASILKAVADLQQFESEHAQAIAHDVEHQATSADWAREGFDLARTHVYLDGDLRPSHVDQLPGDELVPNLSDAYLQQAVPVAREGAVKAACRLASNLAASLPK
jgi:hypothetical protein